jgi:hypothetical protein
VLSSHPLDQSSPTFVALDVVEHEFVRAGYAFQLSFLEEIYA